MSDRQRETVDLDKLWHQFAVQEQLTEGQLAHFKRYAELLREWNAVTNITRIIEPADIIMLHFRDSLALTHARSLTTCRGLCDVGSGGGFPGIPLAICYPQVPVILLEVNNKKCRFLQTVIKELGLTNCQVLSDDFLTFIRGSSYSLDYFVARASLKANELVKVLTSVHYREVEVVYWASKHWEAGEPEKRYIREQYRYQLGEQERFLIFFKRKK